MHLRTEESRQLRARFNQLADRLCISTITLAELSYGAKKSSVATRTAAQSTASLRASTSYRSPPKPHIIMVRSGPSWSVWGRPIGAHDMLIGAHARSAALIIVTNNFSEFERIHGWRVENWV